MLTDHQINLLKRFARAEHQLLGLTEVTSDVAYLLDNDYLLDVTYLVIGNMGGANDGCVCILTTRGQKVVNALKAAEDL